MAVILAHYPPRSVSIARRLSVWASLFVLSSLLSTPLSAAICTALQSGTWGPIDGGTATWDCGTPDDLDGFVIPAGITITVTDDVVQDPAASGGLTVESGATLIARVIDRRLTISLSGAFDCESGSTCELVGGYREFGVASPGVAGDLDQAGYFSVGDLIPCPGDYGGGAEPDCAGGGTARPGDPAVYRFSYPHDRYDAADGTVVDEHVADAIAAIEPGEVVCFFDPEPADPMAPVDDGFCYEIVDRQADPGVDPAYIEIDVRQTNPVAPRDTAYPLALREIGRAAVDQAVAAGERSVDVADSTVSDLELLPGEFHEAERQYLGRWLRFGDGTNSAGATAHKIVRVLNDVPCASGTGTCDRFVIGDPRGFDDSQKAGDEIWLDYGWSTGDPFFVMVPLVVTSSTVNPTDGRVFLSGTVDVEAVLFDSNAGAGVVGATVQSWRNVWFRDTAHNSNGNGNGLLIDDVTTALFERTSMTGGHPDLTRDLRHSVVTRTATDVSLTDLAIRHTGDDCYSHTTTATGMLLERFRCEFTSLSAQSANLFGAPAVSTWSGSVLDAACSDCTSVGESAPVIRPGPGGLSLDGLLIWGAGVRTDPDFIASEPVDGFLDTTSFFDLLSQGSAPTLPRLVDGFVVRDAIGATGQRLFTADHITVTDGIVHEVSTADPYLAAGMDDGSLENIVLYNLETSDPGCPGSCAVIEQQAPSGHMNLRNVTFSRKPGQGNSFDVLFELTDPEADYIDAITVDGAVLTGMNLSTGLGHGILGTSGQATNFLNSSTNQGLGPCFFSNNQDVPPGTTLPATTLTGVDPGFVNPGLARFDLTAGGAGDSAGCGTLPGVAGPGLSRYRWLHAINALVPERMAEDPDGDGVPTDSLVPSCQGGAVSGCSDNCPVVFNPTQADADGDGIGDLCDDSCVGQQTSILRFRPKHAPPGTRVNLFASGLGAMPGLLFGDKPAIVERHLGNRMRVRVPNLPIGETFELTLVNPEGCRSLDSVQFTIDPFP